VAEKSRITDTGAFLIQHLRMDGREAMKWKFWIIGGYLRFKAFAWVILGLAIGWGYLVAEEMGWRDPLRYVSHYLMIFVVPAVLVWVLGVAVHMGYPAAWWFGVAYFGVALTAKAVFGNTEMPWTMWSWVSERLPPFYLRGFFLFGLLNAVLLAADTVGLVALLSPQGRLYFRIKQSSPDDTGVFPIPETPGRKDS